MLKTNLWEQVSQVLPHIERPSRYIASEWVAGNNSHSFERAEKDGSVSFCMVYPDTYELGQPNQALRILVNAVNKRDGMYAERAFLPAVDMIDIMREKDIPAFSLEGMHPLKEFDVIGITLPHELAATNVLEILDLARIPLHAEDRAENDPIVIAGGPCAYNPEPYAAFFDVITIGEGEEVTPEVLECIRRANRNGLSREKTLQEIAKISGNYVPSLYEELPESDAQEFGSYLKPIVDGVSKTIEKRVFEGFSETSAWEPMVVPYMEITHDRLNVEILRGCARGCRFCQAGMMYRPVRERSAENIVQSVREGIKQTGYDEVSLTSLSSTDHSQIAEILKTLNAEFENKGVRISIPSQRLDAFGVDMASLVAGRKKGGLTFAPEAGTQRLRDVINKNITENDLLDAAESAMEAGWRRLKLYFMIGLPTETDEDLIGIADLANRTFEVMRQSVSPESRGSLSLTLSINVFVPKSQTPFQWDGQISAKEAARRVALIRSALKFKAIKASYHEPKTSLIEAVMSRGGRKVSALVESAWRHGARFDAWTENFNSDAWAAAAKDLNIDMQKIASESYDSDRVMPWAHISCGVSEEYLRKEREKALAGITTPDCTFASCTSCDVCFSLDCKNMIAGSRSMQ